MFKVKIHPLFILFALVMVFQGKLLIASSFFIAVLLHEAGHFYSAKRLGYTMNEIVLMPYGAVIYGYENIEKHSRLKIASAGIAASFALCLFLYALNWLIPVSYYFTSEINKASLTIALLNIIPVFPLDGARILLCFIKNKEKGLKILKIAGVLVSLALFILSIISVLFEFNITLAMMSVFLFVGAVSGTEKEKYYHIFERIRGRKAFCPIEKKNLLINENLTLLSVLSCIDIYSSYDFDIVDSALKPMIRLSEEDMRKAFLDYPLYKTVKDVFKYQKN